MPLNDHQVHALLIASRETHDEEIDCEQFLDAMGSLVEARIEGRALPASLALAVAHERLCANCREETQALLDAVGAESP